MMPYSVLDDSEPDNANANSSGNYLQIDQHQICYTLI